MSAVVRIRTLNPQTRQQTSKERRIDMSHSTNIHSNRSRSTRPGAKLRLRLLTTVLPLTVLAAACAGADAAAPAHEHGTDSTISTSDRVAAMLATAGFQDVEAAEDAGYGSSIDTLGCFQ